MKVNSDTGVIVVERPEDWENPMIADVTCWATYEETGTPGVIRLTCHKPGQPLDARVIIETPQAWLKDALRYGTEPANSD